MATAWDPSTAPGDVVFSSGNSVASFNQGYGESCYATASFPNSAKKYFEFDTSGDDIIVGLADAAGWSPYSNLGTTTVSSGYGTGGGNIGLIYLNNSVVQSGLGGANHTHTTGIGVDTTGTDTLVQYFVDASPIGTAVTITGKPALFPACTGYGGQAITANPSPSVVPSGYTAFDGGSGTVYTINADQGSYSITGNATSLNAVRKLSLTQGSYALTGNATAVKVIRKLSLTQGSYSLTGNAAALKAIRNLALNFGLYTITGNASALKAVRKLALTQGSYALTGNAAVLTRKYALSLAQGSYAITGNATSLKAVRKLSLTQGSYVWTGEPVTLTNGPIISLQQGSYGLTGNAAALKVVLHMSLASGSYTMQGYSVTLTDVTPTPPGEGVFTVSGEDVDGRFPTDTVCFPYHVVMRTN